MDGARISLGPYGTMPLAVAGRPSGHFSPALATFTVTRIRYAVRAGTSTFGVASVTTRPPGDTVHSGRPALVTGKDLPPRVSIVALTAIGLGPFVSRKFEKY